MRLSQVSLVPASPAHVGTIAARVREWDRREAAAFGRSPKEALRIGLLSSLWTLTAKVDGRPEAMLGLTPVSLIEGRGQPWMLGTEVVYDHARALVRLTRPVVARMREDCPRLENRAAAGNARAISFLRWAGFEVGSEVEEVGGVGMAYFSIAPTVSSRSANQNR